MSDEQQAPENQDEYVPPKIWEWDQESGGRFANINRPIAGATHDKELPIGDHPIQLYSLGTPNGVKVTVMLEELLALGHEGAEYDAWLINIGEGDQFGSGFVDINPNSKIPAMMDRSGKQPIRLFESASMLVHLSEKFGEFMPKDGQARAEAYSWLFWQMGSAPYLGGGFGHFYAYAPYKWNIQSIVLPWKRSGKWMCWTAIWPIMNSLPVARTPLPIWPPGRGMARWPRVCFTIQKSFCKCTLMNISIDGPSKSLNALPCNAGPLSIDLGAINRRWNAIAPPILMRC